MAGGDQWGQGRSVGSQGWAPRVGAGLGPGHRGQPELPPGGLRGLGLLGTAGRLFHGAAGGTGAVGQGLVLWK